MFKLLTTVLLIMFSHFIFAQTTVTIAAEKDNSMYSDNVNNSNGSGIYLFAGQTAGGVRFRRALIKFDLTSIPSGVTITNATLRVTGSNGGANLVNLHRLNTDWGEGTSNAGSPGGQGTQAAANDATWTNNFYNTSNWGTPGGDFVPTVSSTAVVNVGVTSVWTSAQMITDVQAWLGGTANYGWIMIGEESVSGSAVRMLSRESTSNPPELEITYTNSCASMNLGFNFDATAQQTSWEILDAGGTPVASGGGYNVGDMSANESVCLPDGCYELVVSDSANNGMCPFRATASSSGTFITPGTLISPGSVVATLGTVVTPGLCGNYNLQDANGNVIANGGGSFGASDTNSFCIVGGVPQFVNNDASYARQTPNSTESTTFLLYPTPTDDILNIQFDENTRTNIQLNIVNMAGKIIHKENRTTFNSTIQLNINNLNSGIYFIQIIDNEKIMTKKFVVK